MAIECANVVNLSTTANVIVAPSDSGGSVIQSVLICVNGNMTILIGVRRVNALCVSELLSSGKYLTRCKTF